MAWKGGTYERILHMREMYLQDLNGLLVECNGFLQQHPENEDHLHFKRRLEGLVGILQVKKKGLRVFHRDNLDTVEQRIVQILSSRNGSAPLPQAQLPQPQIIIDLDPEVDGAPTSPQAQVPQPPIVHVDQPVNLEFEVDQPVNLEFGFDVDQLMNLEFGFDVDQLMNLDNEWDGAGDVNASDSVPVPVPVPEPQPPNIDVDQPMNAVNEVGGAGDVNAADEDTRSKMKPIDRPMKAAESLPRPSLAAAVNDMRAVLTLEDTMAGAPPGDGSRGAVGRDLAADSATSSANKRMRRDF